MTGRIKILALFAYPPMIQFSSCQFFFSDHRRNDPVTIGAGQARTAVGKDILGT